MEADFSGYATKAGLACTDGRTIMPDAFKHQDNAKVPLVWQHAHNDQTNVLGHAVLENRGADHPEGPGVYTYGFFNETAQGQSAKVLIQHGDITFLSIYANQLVERAKQVFHGAIREVSLVLAGANPGARIDNVSLAHADGDVEILDDEAIIFTGLAIEHADDSGSGDSGSDSKKTVKDVYNTLSDEQKDVVHFMIGAALEAEKEGDGAEHSDDNKNEGDLTHQEGNDDMTHNVFEKQGDTDEKPPANTLTHDQLSTIVAEGKKNGSFKEAVLAHADEYGITNIDMLFPDAQAIDSKPEWITRRIEWVEGVLNATRKLPFSKIKSLSADLTHEEARAKGYIKASMKKEQFFSIAKRETGPKTIYKKQKLDRDDIVDITEFDVVAWLWVEMRFMLREEIARAILVGDGREVDDPDKIDESKIRPIAFDDEFYTDVLTVPANISPSGLGEAVLRGRENYKGQGQPTAYMLQSTMTDMLLERDKMGRRLYRNVADLAAELQVSNIVNVPVMEGVERNGGRVLMVLVNLSDYSVGSTRGGEISTFEDFDIDFNQHKYLIEGRMSGALTKYKTAQVVVSAAGTEVTPEVPTFDPETGVVTIPATAGVTYSQDGSDVIAGAQTAVAAGETTTVEARPNAGYYFPHNTDADWDFTRNA